MKKNSTLLLIFILLSSCTYQGAPTQKISPDTAALDQATTTAPVLNPLLSSTEPATVMTPPPPGYHPTPLTGHPRLWITPADLPRLRAWAVGSNPLYASLAQVGASAKDEMDSGKIARGDNGGYTSVDDPTESYAELFAFLSMVENEPAVRGDFGKRARTLLMTAIDQAAKGTAAGKPFRDLDFSINDRSRWTGEGFSLTVDWIYPLLTQADKVKIRTVFLRWISENQAADITSYNHPDPPGLVNDPRLLANRDANRYALNNYFTAHMRNIGLMSLALDPADDPDGKLGAALVNATGAWLYIVDHELRTDARGGLSPEGFEYGPQTLSYILQFLLALNTAGMDDPNRFGAQVYLNSNPFWDDMLTAYFHSISPVPARMPDVGPVYQPSWYGDGQSYTLPDLIAAYGALGEYDRRTGNTQRLNSVRWWEANIPAGGAAALADRVRGMPSFTQVILYFMLFDPAAPPASDPRPSLPLFHLAPGVGRLFARTGWDAGAAWFQFALGWNRIDHQDANGNAFGFYRKGEWLTRERMGYANIAEGIASSEFYNTISLQNDRPPDRDPSDWRYDLWQRGSQWNIVASGDPRLIANSHTSGFTYALGDATNLYNSTSESSTDILYASRSIVWLKPDLIITYDRVRSKTFGRFKRFWLQLAQPALVSGAQAREALLSGQQLWITSLLPQGAILEAVNTEEPLIAQTAARDDPMKVRLKIEAPGGPAQTRFLTVLQGADPKAPAWPAARVDSSSGTPFQGALVNGTLVLFPVDLPVQTEQTVFIAPTGAKRILITGLTPGARYNIKTAPVVGGMQISITPGTSLTADGGGVIVFNNVNVV